MGMPGLSGITKWSAVSPLASTAARTGFFLRAGCNNMRLAPFIDEWGERVQMCYVGSISPTITGIERMVLLAVESLRPLTEQLGPRTPIAIALPERFAAAPLNTSLNEEGRSFAQRFSHEISAVERNVRIEYFPAGRAAGALAIARAIEWLGRGEIDFAITGGVDSFYDWSIVEQLQKQDRLLTQDNLDGFIPGEGAAFLGLSNRTIFTHVARMAGVGTAVESHSVLSQEHSLARGITEAMNVAMRTLREVRRRSDYWMVDLTHETYGIKEFQSVITRFGDVLGTRTRLETPLREMGNIGAATLPMFAVLACEAWSRKYAPDRYCVALAGSDSGLRGALLMEEVAS